MGLLFTRGKRFVLLALLGAIGWFGWRMVGGQDEKADVVPPAGAPPRHGQAPTLTTLSDAEAIFTKAFWRRPSPDDHILHAERKEWRGADGLERWQWFLVVEASAGLIQYLREDNAFGLVPGDLGTIGEAPAWFSFKQDEVTLLKAPHGGLRLMFSKSGNTLYATAAGRGFTRGAPEPARPVQGAQAPGRLPSTSPPRPES